MIGSCWFRQPGLQDSKWLFSESPCLQMATTAGKAGQGAPAKLLTKGCCSCMSRAARTVRMEWEHAGSREKFWCNLQSYTAHPCWPWSSTHLNKRVSCSLRSWLWTLLQHCWSPDNTASAFPFHTHIPLAIRTQKWAVCSFPSDPDHNEIINHSWTATSLKTSITVSENLHCLAY